MSIVNLVIIIIKRKISKLNSLVILSDHAFGMSTCSLFDFANLIKKLGVFLFEQKQHLHSVSVVIFFSPSINSSFSLSIAQLNRIEDERGGQNHSTKQKVQKQNTFPYAIEVLG